MEEQFDYDDFDDDLVESSAPVLDNEGQLLNVVCD